MKEKQLIQRQPINGREAKKFLNFLLNDGLDPTPSVSDGVTFIGLCSVGWASFVEEEPVLAGERWTLIRTFLSLISVAKILKLKCLKSSNQDWDFKRIWRSYVLYSLLFSGSSVPNSYCLVGKIPAFRCRCFQRCWIITILIEFKEPLSSMDLKWLTSQICIF